MFQKQCNILRCTPCGFGIPFVTNVGYPVVSIRRMTLGCHVFFFFKYVRQWSLVKVCYNLELGSEVFKGSC